MWVTADHVLLAVIGVVNLFTAIIAMRAHENIKKVELATNSMKDALVATTEKESYARGVKAGESGMDQRGGSI